MQETSKKSLRPQRRVKLVSGRYVLLYKLILFKPEMGRVKVKANGIELYCEEHGEGDPIVFVHGWMEDYSMWSSQIDYFSREHRVIVYDQRGHGRSDKPEKGYSIQTLSDDLYFLTQNLNIERFTLIGHSMGGMTAMVFALDHPEKVSKLILIGTDAKSTLSLHIILWILLHVLPYSNFAEGSDIKYYRPSDQMKKEAVERALRTPKYAAYECFKEFCTNYDIRDRVSDIKIPTLIIAGDKDSLTPVKMNQYLNRQIEGSKLIIISDSKHMPMIEKPDMVNAIVDEFISEITK
jgi:3-oxoadipate enol-lactonase